MRLGIFTVLLLVFVYFLPSIVAISPLKQLAINSALGDFRGKATIDSLSLGWFSPVKLQGLRIVDDEDRELITASQIKLSRSLLGLINTANYGTITVTEPTVSFAIRSDGSNIEDAIAPWLNAPADPNARPVKVQIVVEGGRASVTDVTTGAVCQLEQLQAQVDLPANAAALSIDVQGMASGSSIGNAQSNGKFGAIMSVDPASSELSFAAGQIEVSGNTLPIDIASPFLSRFVEPMKTTGLLDGRVIVAWSGRGERFSMNAFPATLTGATIHAPARIGRDTLVIQDGWLQGEIGITPKSLESKNLVGHTEFATFKANGALTWDQLNAVAGAKIPGSDFQADGTLDIAKVTAMLSETISLHKDVVIESGTVQVNANSHADGTDRRLVVNVESAGLSAVRAGQRIDWHKPVRMVAAVRQGSTGTQIESLECTTNFLKLSGTANRDFGEFTVNGDLQAALAEISRFADFGGVQLAGKIDGKFAWQFDNSGPDPIASRPLRVGGNFRIDQPLVDLPGRTRWSQPELNIVIQAAGQMSQSADRPQSIRIDSGHLELVNALQSMQATLVEPLVNPSLASPIELDCKLGGDVATWLAQARTFFTIDATATGNIDSTARVSVNGNQLTVRNGKCDFRELDFRGFGLTIAEPEVNTNADFDVNLQSGRIAIPQANLRSSTIAARGDNILFDSSSGNGSMSGKIAFRTDINRAMKWMGAPAPDAIQYFGGAEGTIDLGTAENEITGSVDVRVNDLIAARPVQDNNPVQNVSTGQGNWVRLLEEKQATLRSNLKMDRGLQQVQFNTLELISSAFKLQATGSVSDPMGQMVTDLTGTWSPDWALLQPLVQSYTGSLLSINQVTGGDFRMRGPVWNDPVSGSTAAINPALNVETAAAFGSGTLLGLPMGGSSIRVALSNSVANIQCNPISFSGGTINLSPSVDLRGASPVLTVPAGTILNTVELTPEICRGWMRFIAPVIADATAASGKFSLQTEGIQVPLNAVSQANVTGAVVLHGANIGPGPLGQQLMNQAKNLKALASGASWETLLAAPVNNTGQTWMTMPEQTIPFALQQGRVSHQGLKFHVDDVVIQTSGSVGLDQTMQMTAAVPILEKWIGTNKWLASLSGQSLQLPISGTVSQPRIDSSAIASLSQQMLTNAAGNAINQEMQGLINKGNQRLESEIKDGLGRLLGPKK